MVPLHHRLWFPSWGAPPWNGRTTQRAPSLLRACKVRGHRLLWFTLGTTVGFPLEHLIWEKTPLHQVMRLLGV